MISWILYRALHLDPTGSWLLQQQPFCILDPTRPHKKIIGKSLENHRKLIGIILAICGPSMGEACLNNRVKSFLELICFDLVQYNPDFMILKAQNSKIHDFGIFEPVTKPQSQQSLSVETPRHLKTIQKNPWSIW